MLHVSKLNNMTEIEEDYDYLVSKTQKAYDAVTFNAVFKT